MKNFTRVLFVCLLAFTVVSCKKDTIYDPQEYFEIERPLIQRYVNQLDTVELLEDENAMIWGNLKKGESSSEFDYVDEEEFLKAINIKVNYTGKLLDGTVFDEQSDADFSVYGNAYPRGVIDAWVLAFYPKEKGGLFEGGAQVGDVIRIVTSSPFAYGPNARGAIPANSPLDFEIEILEINEITNDY